MLFSQFCQLFYSENIAGTREWFWYTTMYFWILFLHYIFSRNQWIDHRERFCWVSLCRTSDIDVGSYLIYFCDNRSLSAPWVRDKPRVDLRAYPDLHASSRGMMSNDCVRIQSDGVERHDDSVHRWSTHCAWWRSYWISEKEINESTPHWQPRRIFWRQDSREDTAYRQHYPHTWRQTHRK